MKKNTLKIIFLCGFFLLVTPTISWAFSFSDFFSNKNTQHTENNQVTNWQTLIANAQNDNYWQMLNRVNRFFNQIKYVSDAQQWGENDYWATPQEFLKSNAGDCEDYAIAKYHTLLTLGIPANKMRLTHVTITSTNEAHMVLLVIEKKTGTLLALDNRLNKITPFSTLKDLRPIYSFNTEDLWITKTRQHMEKVGKASQIKLWTNLMQRMNNESKIPATS